MTSRIRTTISLRSLAFACGIAAACFAQEVALSGTVTNRANGQKLTGVRLELSRAGLADTTDSLGAYRFGSGTGIGAPDRRRGPAGAGESIGLFLSVRPDGLIVRAPAPAAVRLSLHTSDGREVAGLFRGRPGAEGTAIPWPADLPAHDVLFLRMEADGRRAVACFLPSGLTGGAPILLASERARSAWKAEDRSRSAGLKMGASAAAVDTLRAVRSGYKTAVIPLDSYAGTRDIAMDPEGTGCAAGVLCWDFEEGRIPDGWTPYRTEFTGALLVDGTRPHKGAFALHAKDLIGGKEGIQGGPKRTLRYSLPAGFGPVLWGRAFVYTTPVRPESHAGLFNARYPRPGSSSTVLGNLDWYEFATYQQTYMAVWHPPEPPGYPEWVLHSDKPLVLDAWACLEWSFDGANGTAEEASDPRVWVDGLELSWPEKFVFSDPAGAPKPKMEKAGNFTFLETGVYLYQGLTQATNWWIDDLAVGTGRIGCD